MDTGEADDRAGGNEPGSRKGGSRKAREGAGVSFELGRADTIIATEYSNAGDVYVVNPVPCAPDYEQLLASLRRINRQPEETKLEEHLLKLSEKRLRSPAVVVVLGGPDDMPRAFAERVMPAKLEKILLRYQSLDFQAWPEAEFQSLIRWLNRTLHPDWRSKLAVWRARDDQAQARHVSELIRRYSQSICFAHELDVSRRDISPDVLEAWFDYFTLTCQNPPSGNLLFTILCVSGLSADTPAARWLRARLQASDAAPYVVEMKKLTREHVRAWITDYNTRVKTAEETVPETFLEGLFAGVDTLSYMDVFNRLMDRLRSEARTSRFAYVPPRG